MLNGYFGIILQKFLFANFTISSSDSAVIPNDLIFFSVTTDPLVFYSLRVTIYDHYNCPKQNLPIHNLEFLHQESTRELYKNRLNRKLTIHLQIYQIYRRTLLQRYTESFRSPRSEEKTNESQIIVELW